MGNKLYKYAGPTTLEPMLTGDKCSMKCSYPKDFNDPYELFLTIDYNQPPEVLAFYNETIGRLPQFPTTCFSKSPAVIPMWAHYAQNHQGFVVEIDEEKLSEAFPDIGFGNIEYRDETNEDLTNLLGHAHMTCKPRHTYWLQNAVFEAAYFTKSTCWSYELERRVIAKSKDVIEISGLMLLQAPIDCVTALIAGPKSSPDFLEKITLIAKEIGCPIYEMKIGRSDASPYFLDSEQRSFLFQDGEISECASHCKGCKEPTKVGNDTCPWCAIQAIHIRDAEERNPMRILDRFGMLADYYENANRIRDGLKD
jgi:hypothetical protein